MTIRSRQQFAIVRKIPATFDQCIKPLDSPLDIDIDLARLQHQKYCDTLSKLGFELIILPADNRYPDCPFVEDTAVVIGERAMITRPGAPSRRGEVAVVRHALAPYKRIEQIQPPGTLDGGDVLLAENHLFVGLTERTNQEGFSQMEALLKQSHIRMTPVPMGRTLHLKTACNYLGKGLMVVNHFDFSPSLLSDFEVILSDPSEASRLSILPVGEFVLLPEDCPKAQNELERRGLRTIMLGLSEIRKAQAGLTCMSILFQE
jgi:dimethylargininase